MRLHYKYSFAALHKIMLECNQASNRHNRLRRYQLVQVNEMQRSTTFFEWAKHLFEEIGRARVCAALRAMDEGLLKKAGISPELLEKGPDAWPWQALNDEGWASTDSPIDPVAVDERGMPVPIGSPKRPHPSEPGPQHLAA